MHSARFALCLALLSVGCNAAKEALHIPPLRGCAPRHEIRYCVTAWARDPWNERSRRAVGRAAISWNRVGGYRFREVYCNAPHEVPIFFERGPHADGHELDAWGTELAHASFPISWRQFVHVKDDLAWWQASDTLDRGYDLESVMLHEFGHVQGLGHDEGGRSIMTPYEVRHSPLEDDIENVRSFARRCGVEPPVLDVYQPAPGATWHWGETYTVAWSAPSLSGSVDVDIVHEGSVRWRIWERAPVSGSMPITVNTGWPLGPAYEVCVTHPDTGRICSSMILVAP